MRKPPRVEVRCFARSSLPIIAATLACAGGGSTARSEPDEDHGRLGSSTNDAAVVGSVVRDSEESPYCAIPTVVNSRPASAAHPLARTRPGFERRCGPLEQRLGPGTADMLDAPS